MIRLLLDSPVSSRNQPTSHAIAASTIYRWRAAVVCADGHELASGGVHDAAMPERRLERDQYRSETCKSGRCVFGLPLVILVAVSSTDRWNIDGATGTDARDDVVNDCNAVRGVRSGDLSWFAIGVVGVVFSALPPTTGWLQKDSGPLFMGPPTGMPGYASSQTSDADGAATNDAARIDGHGSFADRRGQAV